MIIDFVPDTTERDFRKAYAEYSSKFGMNPNPDDPRHFYNYRKLFVNEGGINPIKGHLPSKYKLAGHPNRYVGGIDTITGKPVVSAKIDFVPDSVGTATIDFVPDRTVDTSQLSWSATPPTPLGEEVGMGSIREGPSRGILGRLKDRYIPLPPPGGYDRSDRPFRTIAQGAVHHTAEAVSGLSLYTADVATKLATDKDTLAELVDTVTGFEPTPRDIAAGKAGGVVTGLYTAGRIVGPIVGAIPAAVALKTVLSSGLTFLTRKSAEELAEKITKNDPIDYQGIHFEAGVGILFGGGEVGAAKFTKFIGDVAKLRVAKSLRVKGTTRGLNLKDVPDEALSAINKAGKQAKYWQKQYSKGNISEQAYKQRISELMEKTRPIYEAIAKQQPVPPSGYTAPEVKPTLTGRQPAALPAAPLAARGAIITPPPKQALLAPPKAITQPPPSQPSVSKQGKVDEKIDAFYRNIEKQQQSEGVKYMFEVADDQGITPVSVNDTFWKSTWSKLNAGQKKKFLHHLSQSMGEPISEAKAVETGKYLSKELSEHTFMQLESPDRPLLVAMMGLNKVTQEAPKPKQAKDAIAKLEPSKEAPEGTEAQVEKKEDSYINFALNLERNGAARTPKGIDYKIVQPEPQYAPNEYAVERVIKGDRQTIVGFRGDKFESKAQAVAWARSDAKQKDVEFKASEEKALKKIREQPSKEIKHEEKKEAITEPKPSIEEQQRKARPDVSFEPTGTLDPTKPEEAAKIIEEHRQFLRGREKDQRIAHSGIYETEWDKEASDFVITKVTYSHEQVDQAYRTLQTEIDSPQDDVSLFAMPGKEKELGAIGAKMARMKALSQKKRQTPTVGKVKQLPTAKIKKEDYIKAVNVASASESTRYAINGVLVEGNNLVATDGRRLFIVQGKWGKDGLYLDKASIAKGSLGKAGKADKEGKKFPKWQDIMPAYEKSEAIKLNKDDMAVLWRRLHQAAAITTEDSKGVVIILNKDGTLGIAASAPEVGHTEINVKPGGKILGATNPRFIMDALSLHAVRGDKIINFYFPIPERPIFTTSLDGKTRTVTMPVNIGEPSEELKKSMQAETKPKAGARLKPGKLDVQAIATVHKTFINIIEPAKPVEIKYGKDVSAAVIKGIHAGEVGRVEFTEAQIEHLDRSLGEFGKLLGKYPKRVLTNLMAARGNPASASAIAVRDQALSDLIKENPELVGVRRMITRVADFNYKFLQKVVGDDINYVEDYFFGIYKDTKKATVEGFLNHWKTTKRFTKEKKLPTYADAIAYGVELKDINPINNLMTEYVAIARLKGMIDMREELLRLGKDRFISEKESNVAHPKVVNEPVFKGLFIDEPIAHLINNLISTNKVSRHPHLNNVRILNNTLRAFKFAGSAFHHLAVLKQSIADSGYLGFLLPHKWVNVHVRPGKLIPFGLHQGTAARGFTLGFRNSDPIFRTPNYKRYIANAGGHRYSIESETQRAISNAVEKFNKAGGPLVRAGTFIPQIPVLYVKWLFQNYIPKIKYMKTLDVWQAKAKKLGREITDAELQEIIKENQNFYGMMNERLFGRSGTATTLLRFRLISPGYWFGNVRTEGKAGIQWGGGDQFNATRSRSNILNSFLLTGIAATVATLILTGKPPKMPKTKEDVRDLFKVDTGQVDSKGRSIMIDLMTYDKDYWNLYGKVLTGQIDEIPGDLFRRVTGMGAVAWDVMSDLNQMSLGKAVYDWKGDRVVEVTDPFAQQALSLIWHEAQKAEPISTNVFRQARNKDLSLLHAATLTLLGLRVSGSEKDIREQKITNELFSLRDRQERLYYYLGTIKNPRKHVDRYNHIVKDILENPITTDAMRLKWAGKLKIDVKRLLQNKAYFLSQLNRTPDEIKKTKAYLDNFDVSPEQAQEFLRGYWARERTKTHVSPLERDRVIGRKRKRDRLTERLQ